MTKRKQTLWRNKMLDLEQRLVAYYATRAVNPTTVEEPDGSFCYQAFLAGYTSGRKETEEVKAVRRAVAIPREPRYFCCMDCNAKFRKDIITNVSVGVWSAHVNQGLFCPLCGADSQRIVFEPEAGKP